MREPTAHEIAEQERAEQREHNAGRRTQRQDLRRLCPVNKFLDEEHLADLMRQGPAGNRPFLLWRHFTAVGMRHEGYDADTIGRALELAGLELEAVMARVTRWEVPGEVKRRVPLLYPEHAADPEPYQEPQRSVREDYPIVATSGWRTSSRIEPGTRRRTLASG